MSADASMRDVERADPALARILCDIRCAADPYSETDASRVVQLLRDLVEWLAAREVAAGATQGCTDE